MARFGNSAESSFLEPISVEEAKLRRHYYRELYQLNILEGESPNEISDKLNIELRTIRDDIGRIRCTLHTSEQHLFLLTIDAFRGYRAVLS